MVVCLVLVFYFILFLPLLFVFVLVWEKALYRLSLP